MLFVINSWTVYSLNLSVASCDSFQSGGSSSGNITGSLLTHTTRRAVTEIPACALCKPAMDFNQKT